MESEKPTYFCGKSLGRKVKEVSVDLVETEKDSVVSRWYQGPDVDFITWVNFQNNKIIKQQMNFHGQVVEWSRREGLKTGVTIEDDLGQTVNYNSDGRLEAPGHVSRSIKFDPKPVAKCVAWAAEILESIPLESLVLEKLLQNFKK